MSAHAHLFGQFDNNKMPLEPMGSSGQVHIKTGNRKSWDFHTKSAWYLYTSKEHYKTHVCALKSTKTERLVDTAVFHNRRRTAKPLTHGNVVVKAAEDLNGQWEACQTLKMMQTSLTYNALLRSPNA